MQKDWWLEIDTGRCAHGGGSLTLQFTHCHAVLASSIVSGSGLLQEERTSDACLGVAKQLPLHGRLFVVERHRSSSSSSARR